MGRTQKNSPGPKSQKSKVSFAPNVVKEKSKREPVTFLDQPKFVEPKYKKAAAGF